jgi:hypothetical protein
LRDDLPGQNPFSVIRLQVSQGKVTGITDYIKSPWILEAAEVITIAEI